MAINIVDLWQKRTLVKSYIVRLAASLDVCLEREDIHGEPGAYTIDGMPWHEWLDVMTEPTEQARVEKFERIIDLESAYRSERAGVLFAPKGLPDFRWKALINNRDRAKAELYAAVDALSGEELREYGEYRKALGNL